MNEQNANLSRRDFVKVTGFAAAALVAAPAAIQAAAPSEALAGEYGTYTYDYTTNDTCHVYVPYSVHQMLPVYGKNAYLTNGTTPDSITGPFPTDPIYNNAHIEESDGGYMVTVDLKNDAFALLTIGETDTSELALIDSYTTVYSDRHNMNRINQLKIWMPSLGGVYEFTATEHASVSFLNQSKSWNISIQAIQN